MKAKSHTDTRENEKELVDHMIDQALHYLDQRDRTNDLWVHLNQG